MWVLGQTCTVIARGGGGAGGRTHSLLSPHVIELGSAASATLPVDSVDVDPVPVVG